MSSNHRVAGGIEQKGTSRLGAYAANRQEFFPELRDRCAEHPRQGASKIGPQKLSKSFEIPGLLPEISGRTHQAPELSERRPLYRANRQHPLASQVLNGSFNVHPGGGLSQYGANDPPKRSLCRPPPSLAQ